MTTLALLCVRNEGAFLLEWLAHHRAIGFDDFIVFSNDCTDGTDKILDRLQDMGQLTHIRNDGPYDKGGIQFTAMKAAAKMPQVAAADWIMALDVDEFVNIHCGDHSLQALRDALPDATAITLTWRLFGNAGQLRYQDTPVMDTFTQCAPKVMHWPWRAAMFKTLYSNDGTYRKPGVHRPRDPDRAKLDQARWFDGNGRALPPVFATKRIFSDFGQDNYSLAQINHYPLGSAESFVLKSDRGRAVHADDRLGMDYWVERNFNTDEDTTIAATRDARQTELDRLKSDKVLKALHKEAVSWRHQRFETLMREDHFRALYGRLLMTPPSQPVARAGARFLIKHAQRAHQADAE